MISQPAAAEIEGLIGHEGAVGGQRVPGVLDDLPCRLRSEPEEGHAGKDVVRGPQLEVGEDVEHPLGGAMDDGEPPVVDPGGQPRRELGAQLDHDETPVGTKPFEELASQGAAAGAVLDDESRSPRLDPGRDLPGDCRGRRNERAHVSWTLEERAKESAGGKEAHGYSTAATLSRNPAARDGATGRVGPPRSKRLPTPPARSQVWARRRGPRMRRAGLACFCGAR